MLAEQSLKRSYRVIAQVFMVNRVELHMVNQVFDVVVLDDSHTIRFEQSLNSRYDPVQISHMCQDVVGVNDIRRLTTLKQLASQHLAKEFAQCRNATLFCNTRNIARRLNPKHRNSMLTIVLKQVPIVAGNLYDETPSP